MNPGDIYGIKPIECDSMEVSRVLTCCMRLRSISLQLAMVAMLPVLALGSLTSPMLAAPAPPVTTRDRTADQLLQQGDAQLNANQPQAAVTLFQQALQQYRAQKNRAGEGQTLKKLGNAVYLLKQYDQAVAYQQQALAIGRELQDRELESSALNNLGVLFRETGKPAEAVEPLQAAIAIAQQLRNPRLELLARGNLIRTYVVLDKPDDVLEQEPALELARQLRQTDTEAALLTFFGAAYASKENYPQAIQRSQQAITLAQSLKNTEIELFALDSLIKSYHGSGDHANVIKQGPRALQLAQQTQNPGVETRLRVFLSDSYLTLNDYPNAVAIAEPLLQWAEQNQSPAIEAVALNVLSRASSSLEQPQKTVELAQRSLVLAERLQNQSFLLQASLLLGSAYASLGDQAKAITFSEQALKLAQANQIPGVEAVATAILSKVYADQREMTQATAYAERTLATLQTLKNEAVEGQVLTVLVDAYSQLEDYTKTRELIQRSLEIARRSQNRTLEVNLLIAQSGLENRLGHYQTAVDGLKTTLAIAQATQQPELESQIWISLGDNYDSSGNYTEGVAALQKGLALARQTKNRKLEASALAELASIYDSLSEYQKAIEAGQQSLAIANELNAPELGITAFTTLANVYMQLGAYDEFIKLARQGISQAQSLRRHPVFEAVELMYQSIYAFTQENYDETISASQRLLRVSETIKTPIWQTQIKSAGLLLTGIGYGGQKRYTQAIPLVQQSLTLAQSAEATGFEETILNILGSLYRHAGQRAEALRSHRAALAFTRTDVAGSEFYGQAGLARTYRDMGMPLVAITHYKQAINSIEQVRRNLRGLSTDLQKSFLQSIQDLDRTTTADIYRELADLLLSQGRILEAQDVVERLKVQEIREFTRSTRSQTGVDVAYNQAEQTIKQQHGSLIALGQQVSQCKQSQCHQLSQLNDQLDVLTQRYNETVASFEKDIRDRRANDDAFLDPTKLGNIKRIVDAQAGTVLIYPFVLKDKTWLLWAAPGGVVKSIELPVNQQTLGQTVLKFRQAVQDPQSSLAELQATGKQLYDWLIKPLEAELQASKIQHLVFSLDRVTRYIPVAALYDGEQYLVEKYTLSTVLSAGLTRVSDRWPPGKQNTPVLALGASEFKNFSPLPNVPTELNQIVQDQASGSNGIYPGQKFLNRAFDFRALRDNLPGHKVLHIATHAEFVPGRPEESYLVLGTGEKLTIPQIQTLQDLTDVHLVVLSACQTALGGPDQDGVEISGLSSYFLNNGAAAVLASLWSVDDASTSQLMQQFYDTLAQGTAQAPITKAAALRQAQLGLLRGQGVSQQGDQRGIGVVSTSGPRRGTPTSTVPFAHPFYWAPFTLIGNAL